MRIFVLALVLFVTFHFIRIDLAEGTIPLASFMGKVEPCVEEAEFGFIPITTVDGDTIESLFALYPDTEMGFLDRLSSFYSLNPHLQNQKIVGGEKIRLPLTQEEPNACSKKNV
ncbi:hypothetical protein AB1K83_06320 [Sporosarcina sp. 179-K 3D1 HS]|uniref:hypothetical protein n=1 Tax=Sporosarcina sp. 179-K 3D1 HS TaxID=3232169 RepID=UPI0039A35680